MQVAAQKKRLDDLAQFGESEIGRVGRVVPGKSSQDAPMGPPSRCAAPSCILHLIVLLTDEVPVDGTGQDRHQRRYSAASTAVGR